MNKYSYEVIFMEKHNHEHNHDCACHEHEHEHHHHGDGCGHDHEHHHHDDCCGHEHHHDECGCGCGHEHGGEEKPPVVQMISGAILFVIAFILRLAKFDIPSAVLFGISFIVLGYDIVIGAVKGVIKGRMLDENFLMSIASIGAFAIGDYPEAVAVMLFYRIGETLQDMAVDKSRKSITALMDIRPDYANLKRDGEIVRVSPEDVHTGDTIVIKNGEKVPLDCVVVNGSSFMDTVALTGESVPRKVQIGSELLSGYINTDSPIYAEVTKEYHESTVAKILEITEHARERKSHSEKFITKFAHYYTPIVVIAAILLATVPSIIVGDFKVWLYRALIFLVVSCPCALVVSVPLGFFAGIGSASRKGILIKGGSYLELLSKLKTVVFDKTGTLTKGVFEVSDIRCDGDKEKLAEYAAYAESFSNHPIAKAIVKHYGKDIDRSKISDYTEKAGMGISVKIDGADILCGNIRLMAENKIYVPDEKYTGTAVYVAVNGQYSGMIIISDTEKEDSLTAVSTLTAKGISTVMLTGDTKESALPVAEHLGIEKAYCSLLPQDKVARMEQIMSSSNGGATAFVGDGINDAPVLAMSDIGIAMGGIGSDSAVEAADIVLMTDEPSKIVSAVSISRKTMRIVKENIIFALAVKAIIMLLGALGITGMWLAIFADVGVSLIAVINSLRALY